MADPNVAVVYRDDGEIHMVVIPDREEQLDDPAFNPVGHVQVRIAKTGHDGQPDVLALMKATVDALEGKDRAIAERTRALIALREAELLPPAVPEVSPEIVSVK